MTHGALRPPSVALFLLLVGGLGPWPTTAATSGASQDATPARLTLEALFTERAWDAESLGPVRWLDKGAYSTLEPLDGVPELVRYDALSGDREVLIGAHELQPEFRAVALRVEDYTLSPDRSLALLFTDSERVWRSNTRGDYWLFDLRERTLSRLDGAAPDSSLMFAKFSPDGTRIAYVRANDLYLRDLRNDVVTRLTHDGSPTLANGTSDWVYEEELGIRDGFRWSPDGERIAFWQLDDSLVREFVLADNTAGLYPVLTRFPYPKAGEINPAARIGVIPAGGGATVWLQLPGSPRNHYAARMHWVDPETVAVQQLNRAQNQNRLFLGNARNGTVRRVLLETDDAWLDPVDDMQWLDGGRAFTWVSARDGWRRVYRVARDASSVRPLTPAGVDAMGVAAVDEVGGWLYFYATDDPTRRFLYRAPLTGSRGREPVEATRVTPSAKGTHAYDVAPGAGWAFHTASSYDSPPRVSLVRLPGHDAHRVLLHNDALRARLAGLELPPTEAFRIALDADVALDAWALKPRDFDPARRYPLLFYVYGEPWGQTVLDRWPGVRGLWHRYLTELGYVVMSVDNRGTPAPRGRAWRKVVHGEIGTLAAQDQADAVRAIAARYPWVDSDRIGIWGWSGGGSMTLNALFRHPEVYATGMSVAPVPDQRLYDTIYQERYMGRPQDNPEGYRRGSPITHAAGLRGNLLLVHGTGDDNVHYQGTEALIDRLVELGKPFTMMAYPNRTHAIREGEGTTRHLYGLLTRYLTENLPPGPR